MDNKKCIVIFLTEDTATTYNGKPLMLQDALFCPILTWCMRAWLKKGVRRFFVVCDGELVDEVTACFPAEAAAVRFPAARVLWKSTRDSDTSSSSRSSVWVPAVRARA